MQIKKIGVVGAGVMGHGIIQVCAQGGHDVIVVEATDELANKGYKLVEGNLARLVVKGKMTEADKAAIMGRIKLTTNLADLKDADYVEEAVFEIMDLKKKVFKELDQIMPPHAILSTNTSTLSITEIASVTKRPDKCIGMHFFNPPPVMRLVEIVRGYQTSDETAATMKELAEKSWGKETIVVKKDTPGFVVNRVFIPYLIEAMRMFEEGVASPEDIDKGVKFGLNLPMGPFELMDLTGNDTNVDVFGSMERELGREFSFQVPYTLKAMAKAGKLGRKSGVGWYKYEKK
jgi:3-hydroxybutyryl-CoA dehydrogenase